MNRAFAQALATPLIDLDAPELPPITLDVDEEVYARYVEQYIKRPGTPEKPFWSVVASDIISDSKNLSSESAHKFRHQSPKEIYGFYSEFCSFLKAAKVQTGPR